MYLTYLDASDGQPRVFIASPGSTNWQDLLGGGGGYGFYHGDPASVAFQGGYFIMFRSAYSSDNLWVIGTNGNFNFGPPQMYGQTLLFSPNLTVVPNQVLFQSGFTNYPSSGTFMWIAGSTANQVLANPQYSGGGGGDPGPGNGCQGSGNCVEQDVEN